MPMATDELGRGEEGAEVEVEVEEDVFEQLRRAEDVLGGGGHGRSGI